MGISPQSVSSLSTFFQEKSDLVTFQKLQTVFQKLGVKAIYNLGLFNELALLSSFSEFQARFNQSLKMNKEQIGKVKKSVRWNYEIGCLPILASECPGWVCYAEKTVGQAVIPFMSKVKSS